MLGVTFTNQPLTLKMSTLCLLSSSALSARICSSLIMSSSMEQTISVTAFMAFSAFRMSSFAFFCALNVSTRSTIQR